MKYPNPTGWPEGKTMAVCVNVICEQWGDNAAPGAGPFANPIKPGFNDLASKSWAEYAKTTGLFRLLDICEKLDVTATVALSGILGARNPELFERAAQGGHSFLAHSWSQDRYHVYMERDEEDAEIKRCIAAFEQAAGRRPFGYGCPRGALSADTAELLVQNGFTWMQDFLDSDVPYDVDTPSGPIVNIPYNMAVNDLPIYVRHGNPPNTLVDSLRTVLNGWDNIGAPHYILDISAHSHVLGRPTAAVEFYDALALAKSHDAVWLTTRDEIAARWQAAR
ncbi:polysaccharide deacetylase family protein [Pseudorhodobacter sp. W20_MBD10_FR17]|uniref:polysaccharide deacetylase family protein n=1 Tax=Pseudorhodobacter sp. W20_MBD10_FR17 TaxID=3240266 RepID=UPI003F95E688